jgi:hypothetical protein
MSMLVSTDRAVAGIYHSRLSEHVTNNNVISETARHE